MVYARKQLTILISRFKVKERVNETENQDSELES